MAKKGQKFRMFTNLEREEIIQKYMNGNYSYQSLANEYYVNPKTVQTMVLKYRKTGRTSKLKPPGRSGGCGKITSERELTKEDYKERYEIIKKYQAFLKAQRERK